MVRYGLYSCRLGTLVVGWEDCAVISLKLSEDPTCIHEPSPVSDLAACQITEYLDGRRKEFDFPISVTGTPFQMAVWQAIRQIPYGETRTYSQISAMIGKPRAVRAVGQAANRNPIWIGIPCHRVVGKGQALTGYAGGLQTKLALLQLEANTP